MKKKNRITLPAIMLIFVGIVIIVLAFVFSFINPSITGEQVSNLLKLKNM